MPEIRASFEQIAAAADRGFAPKDTYNRRQYTQEEVRALDNRKVSDERLARMKGVRSRGFLKVANIDSSHFLNKTDERITKQTYRGNLIRVFSELRKKYTSDEYRDFRNLVHEKLGHVQGKTIIFDIERTLIFSSQTGRQETLALYPSLWMEAVIEELSVNEKNSVIFLTSARKASISELRDAMSSPVAELPCVDKDDWIGIIQILRSGLIEKKSHADIAKEIKQAYPQINERACAENMPKVIPAITRILNIPQSEWKTDQSREKVDSDAAYTKFPAFLFGGEVLFVDDNSVYKNGAVQTGLNAEHFVLANNNLSLDDMKSTVDAIATACKS